ncbi:restriction endonuclease subunit S [Helicobacter bilis]|uniref:restriction endonuclease subunit S n=1 Tax=Helicobacter bilis TaxID=37372 RepID=UPI0009879983|nr:restriction endonuclease subunit S [Helicobacter bilis]
MKKHTQSPYESSKVSYKPSGIEWLGEIPQSWEIRRLKHLTILFTGESIKDADKDKYSIVENAIPYIATKDIGLDSNDVNYNNGMFIQNDDTGFKRAYKNSTLLCLEGANAGKKIAFLNQEVCFVNKLCCISNKSKELDSKALFYFFQGSFFKNTFFSNISGLIGGVTTTQLGNFKIPLPPLQEQKEIAEFLDSKCEKIQNYIDKKQKLITLLQEKKQALINEAATKGLNPNIESKNSDIEYLGLIPHHWEVVRSGLIYKNISSGTTPQSDNDEYYKNGNIFWINSGDLNDSVLTNSKNKITQKAMMAHSALKIFPKGSLIIAMYGATIGKVSILGIDACTNQACCVLCESKYLNTRFVFYYFVAKRQDLISMAYGGGQPNISQDIIKNFKIPLPPLQEQEEIAAFLDSKVAQIDSAIEKTKKQIELVKEYKNTLINEAVCGRIRVN